MMEDIGKEIQALKVQSGLHFSIDRAITQGISDTNKLWAVIAIFERVIHSAFDQKLAPGALSVDVLKKIINHIKDTAATNKFQNFIHQPSDLYKLKTSFIHHPEEQTVILILYVPFVEAENLLPRYEFISLPIYFNFSWNISVIPDVGKSNLIAIGNTEAFQTLSTSDLANCKRLGQTFLCKGRSVLQTNIVQDCLGSIYLGSATLIKANSKFCIDSTREKIYSLGNNTWVVYSIGTIATNQVCPKAGTLSPLTIKSGQSVTVSHGCHIPTMDHMISADNAEDMAIVNSWLDWTMSLSQLFNHNDNKQLTAMITDLRKYINGNFDASQLLKRLDTVQKPFSADHWRFSSPAAMLGAAILITVIAFAVWKKFCAQPSHTATAPIIPAPMPQQLPQPQIQLQPVQPQMQIPPVPAPAMAPSAHAYMHHQNPTFNFSKPTAPVLIYT
jgi:hypothetical protein